jgi:hypothetical protein
MAFLRFTRDKRGYEHFSLVQPSSHRSKSPARVLYWFRTPPNVKVGREPFDERIRRELEAQNPDVTFDWRKILETPIPSADADMWRERRRAARAARAAKRTDVGAEVDDSREDDVEDEAAQEQPVHVLEAAADSIADRASNEGADSTNAEQGVPDATAELRPVGSGDVQRRKRRRRRRRRGPSMPQAPGGAPPPGSAGDV